MAEPLDQKLKWAILGVRPKEIEKKKKKKKKKSQELLIKKGKNSWASVRKGYQINT